MKNGQAKNKTIIEEKERKKKEKEREKRIKEKKQETLKMSLTWKQKQSFK